MNARMMRFFQPFQGWFFVPMLVLTLGAKPADSKSTAAAVREFRGVDYSAGQKLDLFVPEGKGTFPCFVMIHGGAWSIGSRLLTLGRYPHFISRGWAFATIDYRLVEDGRNPFPAQILDCKEAIRFLRRNASRYGIDPDRICVGGSSAGGHLAALVGLTGGIDPFTVEGEVKDDPDSRVSAVVDLFGPTDMSVLVAAVEKSSNGYVARHRDAKTMFAFFGSHDLGVIKSKCAFASPVTYVDQARSAKLPPFLILHSKGDPTVPYSQSVRLSERLKAAGVPCVFKSFDGKKHAVPKTAWKLVFDFISEKCR